MKLPVLEPITLPCGITLKNRIGKSAMSEILGGKKHQATHDLVELYKRWARGGSGLLITGNVMIDSNALGEPSNVVVEDDQFDNELRNWAKSGQIYNCSMWMQINHPGKQSPSFLSSHPVAPSAIQLEGSLKNFFNRPHELTHHEILKLIERYAFTARKAKETGFGGVQIHGAHGYLVSQFLSAKHNHRADEWGGSAEKRRRFVLEVYQALRRAVGPNFPIGIKINSSDFQKSGLSEVESLSVMQELDQLNIDLIEISGGTYERPAMMGRNQIKEEPYFADFSKMAKNKLNACVMLTGGIRTAKQMNHLISNHYCDIIGLARPLVIDPNLPKKILISQSDDYESKVRPISTGFRSLDKMSMINITWYERQMKFLSQGKDPRPNYPALCSVMHTVKDLGLKAFKPRRSSRL